MKPEIQISENIVWALIKSVGLRRFTIALSNALYHGKILKEVDLTFDQIQLGIIYKYIDGLMEIAKEIES